MNENYKWKGETFNSKGVIIEETPIMTKPKRKFTQYTIPGKNGYMVMDNKTYEPIPFTLKCHYKEGNGNRENISSWLDGYGKLQIDNEKEYTGFISNSIPFEKVVRFRKFQVQFMLQPIAKAINSTIVNMITTGTFNSDTYTDAYPTITLTGTGTITIGLNGTQFTIYDANGTYILDCEAKVITKNGANASGSMSGDFPRVINGNNALTVTGTVTALSIEYKKSYL